MEKKGKIKIEVRDVGDDSVLTLEETVRIKAKNKIEYFDRLEESLKNLAQEAVDEAYSEGEDPRSIYGKITQYDGSFTNYDGDINDKRVVSISEEYTTSGDDDTEECISIVLS